MTEPETIDASLAADILAPVTPRPTDGVAPADPQAAPQEAPGAETEAPRPAPASEPGMRDAKGQTYDPARHAPGPSGRGEFTARGTWRLKGARGRPFGPGNKARAKAGTVEPEPEVEDAGESVAPAPESATAPQGPPPPRASFIAQPGAPGAGPDAIAAEPVPLTDPSEYKTTAEAITRASFGVGQIAIGPEWEPTTPEQREWVAAWSAFLAEIQAPKLGAFASILVLAVTSWGKRAQHPATARVSRNIMDTIRGWFGMRPRRPAGDPFADPAPAPARPQGGTAPAEPAAPARPAAPPSTAADAAAGPYSRGA